MPILDDNNPKKIVHNNSFGLSQNNIPIQVDINIEEMVVQAFGISAEGKENSKFEAREADRGRVF